MIEASQHQGRTRHQSSQTPELSNVAQGVPEYVPEARYKHNTTDNHVYKSRELAN